MPLLAGKSPRLPSEGVLLAGLLVLALVVRGGVLLAMRDNLEADPDGYREIAENLLRCGEFATGQQGCEYARFTAYRPPLYPVVLSNLPAADAEHVSLGKVAVLHVLLGVATVWLTYLTARRYMSQTIGASALLASGGREPPEADRLQDDIEVIRYAPLVAGTIVACDPILLNQQTLVMTETLATFLAILSLWCLARFEADASSFKAALAGGAIGLAVLCRPTFLPWLGIVGIGLLFLPRINSAFSIQHSGLQQVGGWSSWRKFGRRTVSVVALGVATAVVLAPWTIRNQREFGKPIVTTTHGGYTFYLANNDHFYSWLKSDTSDVPWNSKEFDYLWQNEKHDELVRTIEDRRNEDPDVVWDRMAYQRATAAIKNDREAFILACLYRIGQLWSPLPHKLTADESTGRTLLRYVTAAWYCGVYVLAAIGVWRLRTKLLARPWIWGVLLCLVFTAVHTFYWSNLRMRAPLMPFVGIVAAAGLSSSHTSPKRKRG